LFEVEYADRDGNSLSGRDRYRSMQIAQVFLKGTQQAALLFDEVEDVFPPVSVDAAGLMARHEQQALAAAVSHSVSGKAWVNQILESNPVPTIWVTNRIEQIDPAFRRRFAYHLELRSPPPGAREQLVRKTLDGVAVSEAFVARLTGRKGLTPAQIRTAVRFAGLAHGEAVAEGPGFEALDRAATEERRRGTGQHAARRTGPPAGHHLGSGDAQCRDPLRDSPHRRGPAGARPRHPVLSTVPPAPARPRWASTLPSALQRPLDRQAGQRPDEQIRRRDRAERWRPCSARPRQKKPCCCWTRPTASCRTAGAPRVPTR
jgi:hypothetical protein